jgi:GDSL-like lipase/acylhydrolase family protein/SGNH-like hydrolase/esterase family protein
MNFFKSFLLLFTLLISLPTALQATEEQKDGLFWVDARELGLEGQGWTDTALPYDRLPARAEEVVNPTVWKIQHRAAGLCLRFETDSPEIHGDWDGGITIMGMTRIGYCGLDIYVWKENKWVFLNVGKPEVERTVNKITNAPKDAEEMTEYLVFLPLYHQITEMRLGFVEGSTVRPSTRKRPGKPIVVYGTSITQGAAASRPGMCHVATLSRRLDREFINLGFEASGRMEPEMAQLIRELDAELFIFECLPNMNDQMVTDRVAPFVRLIREEHSTTPIILAENCGKPSDHEQNKRLKIEFDKLISEGTTALYHLPSEKDGEAMMLNCTENPTVDGLHPTDLGFFFMANYYETFIREVLKTRTTNSHK